MICKNCIHYDVCGGFTPTDLDQDVFDYCREGRSDEIPDIEKRCGCFKDKSRYLEVPCKVGDTVYCDICNEGRGYLDKCTIKFIEFDADWNEPLFTAICRERAEYQTYWASDFGKTIFHEPQFLKKTKKATKGATDERK